MVVSLSYWLEYAKALGYLQLHMANFVLKFPANIKDDVP